MVKSSGGGGTDDTVYPACQNRSQSVPVVTLYHILEPSASREVNLKRNYLVCRERSFPLLYYSSDHSEHWETSDALITVGFKQPEDESPHPV